MGLIVGDDFAKGKFMRIIFDKFRKMPFATILVPRDPLGDQRAENDSAQEFVTHTISESDGNTGMCISLIHRVHVEAS